MKKYIVLIMTTALLLLCATAVSASDTVVLRLTCEPVAVGSSEVTATISTDTPFMAKALYLGDLDFDTTVLELVSGKWLLGGAAAGRNLDPASWSGQEAVIAFDQNTEISGDIFSLTFTPLADYTTETFVSYTCEIRVKNYFETTLDNVVCEGGWITIEEQRVQLYIDRVQANAFDGTVSVNVNVRVPAMIKSLSIQPREIDGLKLIGGEWLLDGVLQGGWTEENPLAVLAFSENTLVEGPIFRITYQILDNSERELPIDLLNLIIRKKSQVTGGEVYRHWSYTSGSITINGSVRGDVNADGVVNSNDAVYLLRHTLNAARYPLSQSGDMNGDGTVESADAIYLLRHVLVPDRYPLS